MSSAPRSSEVSAHRPDRDPRHPATPAAGRWLRLIVGQPRAERAASQLPPDGLVLMNTGMGSHPDVDAHYRPRQWSLATAGAGGEGEGMHDPRPAAFGATQRPRLWADALGRTAAATGVPRPFVPCSGDGWLVGLGGSRRSAVMGKGTGIAGPAGVGMTGARPRHVTCSAGRLGRVVPGQRPTRGS